MPRTPILTGVAARSGVVAPTLPTLTPARALRLTGNGTAATTTTGARKSHTVAQAPRRPTAPSRKVAARKPVAAPVAKAPSPPSAKPAPDSLHQTSARVHDLVAPVPVVGAPVASAVDTVIDLVDPPPPAPKAAPRQAAPQPAAPQQSAPAAVEQTVTKALGG